VTNFNVEKEVDDYCKTLDVIFSVNVSPLKVYCVLGVKDNKVVYKEFRDYL
jgi:hypothetical protein